VLKNVGISYSLYEVYTKMTLHYNNIIIIIINIVYGNLRQVWVVFLVHVKHGAAARRVLHSTEDKRSFSGVYIKLYISKSYWGGGGGWGLSA
jgi:hypothetical protein